MTTFVTWLGESDPGRVRGKKLLRLGECTTDVDSHATATNASCTLETSGLVLFRDFMA